MFLQQSECSAIIVPFLVKSLSNLLIFNAMMPLIFSAINEHTPAFPLATYTVNVDENVVIGFSLFTVPAATDSDQGEGKCKMKTRR